MKFLIYTLQIKLDFKYKYKSPLRNRETCCFLSLYKLYLQKQGATWNHLKPRETSWNHLKKSETTQTLPETSWNKPYYNIFLLKKSYFQVAFVLILHPKVFFRQIWSWKLKFPKMTKIWWLNLNWLNLKFSKLTEIWYRGTLLYAYYEFNVNFFKSLVIHISLG